MKIQNKKFIVTGGGSGIGREIVFGLLHRGAKVIAVDINKDNLDYDAIERVMNVNFYGKLYIHAFSYI